MKHRWYTIAVSDTPVCFAETPDGIEGEPENALHCTAVPRFVPTQTNAPNENGLHDKTQAAAQQQPPPGNPPRPHPPSHPMHAARSEGISDS